MASNAERQRQFKARKREKLGIAPRPVGRPRKAPNRDVEPCLYFSTPTTVPGYRSVGEIRPAFEQLECSGPVVTLVRDGKLVLEPAKTLKLFS